MFGVQPRDLGGDPRRLLLGVVRGVADDRLALAQRGPQFLGLAALVVGDDRVRRVQDGLRRTVVLFEHDGLGVREVLFEVLDVADVRAAERVDRLVGVADDGDPGRPLPSGCHGVRLGPLPRIHAGQLPHEHVLRVVGVLVLVDEDVAELVPVVFGDHRAAAQQFDGAHDQVVEVHGVRHGEPVLVFGVDDRVQLLHVAEPAELVALLARLVVGRIGVQLLPPPLQVVLVIGDARQDGAGRVAFEVDVQIGADELDQALAVGGVVDGESGFQSDLLAVAPQDAHAGGVEGGHPHALGHRPDQPGQAFAHLGGGLVGERDGQDLAGPGAELGEDPGDAARQHAGFAGARAGADEQRLPAVLHGLGLLRVQVADEIVGGTHDEIRILWHAGPFPSRIDRVRYVGYRRIHVYHIVRSGDTRKLDGYTRISTLSAAFSAKDEKHEGTRGTYPQGRHRQAGQCAQS